MLLLQLCQCVFETTSILLTLPKEMAKMIVDFDAAKEIFERLIGEPSAPIATKSCTCQQNERHREVTQKLSG